MFLNKHKICFSQHQSKSKKSPSSLNRDRYSNRELNEKGLASKNILKDRGRADVRSSRYPEEEGPTSHHPH